MTVAKTGKTGAGAKTPSKAKPAAKPGSGASARARKPVSAPVVASVRPVGNTGTDVPVAAKAVTLRKKELIERVAAVSGVKKQDTRAIIDAVLAVLGDALAAGETLALPPLGKARVNRHKDVDGGEMLTVKLRRGGPATAKEPLAETGE
jgi:nucleoid DNA-binding protein